MISEIYIRPLREFDAEISYHWRNDPDVWKLTGSRPDREIMFEIERNWITDVLARSNETRFAICIRDSDEYIGNVQLTSIDGYQGEFHIFIGAKEHWGKGYGTLATKLLIDHAFNVLGLQCVYLNVKKINHAAVRAYEKAGFLTIVENGSVQVRMAKYAWDTNEPAMVSVFMMTYNHEKFVSQAIEGILMQETSFGFQIVVGEDCSTDRTRQILLDYAIKNPGRFKLILHDTNIGAARNQLCVLALCNGKYIAMCEGDDYWTDRLKLQKQVDFLEANPDFAICFHRVKIVDESTGGGIQQSNIKQKEVTDFEDLAKENYIHTLSCLFRNHFEEFPEWYVRSPVGDYPLHLMNARRGKIKYIDEVMGVYRMHSLGLWSLINDENRREKWLSVLKLCKTYFSPRGTKEFERQILNAVIGLCFCSFENERYVEFRNTFVGLIKERKITSFRTFLALTARYLVSYQVDAANLYRRLFANKSDH